MPLPFLFPRTSLHPQKRSQRIHVFHVSQCQAPHIRAGIFRPIRPYFDTWIWSLINKPFCQISIHGFSFNAAMSVHGRRCCLTSLVHAVCLLPIARHISSHQRDSTRPCHVPCKEIVSAVSRFVENASASIALSLLCSKQLEFGLVQIGPNRHKARCCLDGSLEWHKSQVAHLVIFPFALINIPVDMFKSSISRCLDKV